MPFPSLTQVDSWAGLDMHYGNRSCRALIAKTSMRLLRYSGLYQMSNNVVLGDCGQVH